MKNLVLLFLSAMLAIADEGNGRFKQLTIDTSVTVSSGASLTVAGSVKLSGLAAGTGTLTAICSDSTGALFAGGCALSTTGTSGQVLTTNGTGGLGIPVTLPLFPAGVIIGDSDSQALTNKTVDGVSATTLGYLDATSSVQTQLNAKAPTAAPTLSATATVIESGASYYGVTLNLSQPTVASGDGPHMAWMKAIAGGSTQYWNAGIDHGTTATAWSVNEGANFGLPRLTIAVGGAVSMGGQLSVGGSAAFSSAVAMFGLTAGSGTTLAPVCQDSVNSWLYVGGCGTSTNGTTGQALTSNGSGGFGTAVTLPTFPTGAVVGTTDSQALTNKTIDGVSAATLGYLDATSSIQTQLNGKISAASPTLSATATVTESGNSNYGITLNLSQSAITNGDGPHVAFSKMVSGGATQYWNAGIDHGITATSWSVNEGASFGVPRLTIASGPSAVAVQITATGALISTDGLADVLQYAGCDRTGASDSTSCLQAAITANAGKALRIPAGTYLTGQLNLVSNLRLSGDGASTILKRNATVGGGLGLLDLANLQNVRIENLLVDGQVASPTGVDRGTLASSYTCPPVSSYGGCPLNSILTANTTVWIHGGTNIDLDRVTIQHSGGEAVLVDATAANVDNVKVSNCTLQNNRPNLFGSAGDNSYGGWGGGILYVSDGVSYNIQNLSIVDNTIKWVAGNGIWGWAPATSLLNTGITVSRNHFRSMGLDSTEPGPVNGYTEQDNTVFKSGYVSTSDSVDGTPKWINIGAYNVPAVAFDGSGLATNVVRTGNVAVQVNGGCLDLDGFSYGLIANNRCYVPRPAAISTDSDYPRAADLDYSNSQPGSWGPGGNGQNWHYGINTGNSNNTAQGASDLTVVGNSFYGFGGGSIRLYAARHVLASGNKITTPTEVRYFPIVLGNVGATDATQHAWDNTVENNKITYFGATGIYAIYEDCGYTSGVYPTGTCAYPFQSGDVNKVHDQELTGALAAFAKDTLSSSVNYGQTTVTTGGLTTSESMVCDATSGAVAVNCVTFQPYTASGHTSGQWYFTGVSLPVASLTDLGAFTSATGSFTTGLSAPVMTIGSGASSVSGSLGISGSVSMGGASTVNEAGNVNNGWSFTLNESTATNYDGPHLGWAKLLSTSGTQYWRAGIDPGGTVGSWSIGEGSGASLNRLTIAQGGAISIPQTLTVTGAVTANGGLATCSTCTISVGTGASNIAGSLSITGGLSAASLTLGASSSLGIGSGGISTTGNLSASGTLGVTGAATLGGQSTILESGNTNWGWSLTLQQTNGSATDGPGLAYAKALASGGTQYWRAGLDHGTNVGSWSISEGANFGTDRVTIAQGGAVSILQTLTVSGLLTASGGLSVPGGISTSGLTGLSSLGVGSTGISTTGPISAGTTLSGASGSVSGNWSAGSLSAGSLSVTSFSPYSLSVGAGGLSVASLTGLTSLGVGGAISSTSSIRAGSSLSGASGSVSGSWSAGSLTASSGSISGSWSAGSYGGGSFGGAGVYTPSYGHTASGFNPYPYTGSTVTVTLGGGAYYSVSGTNYFNMDVTGGVIRGFH